MSDHPSVLPTGVQPWGVDKATRSLLHLCFVAPTPPPPVQCLRRCSMFYVFLNEELKATAPYPTLTATPAAPELPTPLPQ